MVQAPGAMTEEHQEELNQIIRQLIHLTTEYECGVTDVGKKIEINGHPYWVGLTFHLTALESSITLEDLNG